MSGKITLRQKINRVLHPSEFKTYEYGVKCGIISPVTLLYFQEKFGEL